MTLEELWHFKDEAFLNSLIPAFAYSEGDHYANSWLLGKVRLILAFPLLTEQERDLIQEARLAAEELRIMVGHEELAKNEAEKASYAAELSVLKEEYVKAMEAIDVLCKQGRVTSDQESLLKSELACETNLESGSLSHPPEGAAISQ